jgi:putative transposase
MKNRKPNRLNSHDYNYSGYYYITIDTKNNECFFGKINNDKMNLSNEGKIANQCWLEIPSHFPRIELDEFIIMPNHIHGIIILPPKASPYGAGMPAPYGEDLKAALNKKKTKRRETKLPEITYNNRIVQIRGI